jgi:hypothetical protein
MSSEPQRVIWHSEVRGSKAQGYVRIQVFVHPETGQVRTEVEQSDFLGMAWNPMPQIG